jgi:ribosome biogenesis protein
MTIGCLVSLASYKGMFFHKKPANQYSLVYRHFITSSYDGHIRSFDYSKNMSSSALLHSAPITSFCLLSSQSSSDETETITVATASHDLTGQLTQLTVSDISGADLTVTNPNENARASTKPLATLHLHTAPLASITVNSASSHLLTASWDHLIGLWDTTIPESDEVPEDTPVEGARRTKRRKVDGERAIRKAPLMVLKSHTGRVSRAIFGPAGGGDSTAYSCGFDSTIRTWDTENGLCTRTIVSLSNSSCGYVVRKFTNYVFSNRPLPRNLSFPSL